MTKYQDPIYDRTAQDIEDKVAKAYFNLLDFERIYHNAIITGNVVDTFMGSTTILTPLTAPTITSIPAVSLINTLIENIELVRVASGLPEIEGLAELKHDWLAGSGASGIDYEDVNEWEKAIHTIIGYIEESVSYRVYCGVSAVGQPRFYQNRWRVFFSGVPDSLTPVRRTRMNVGNCGTGLTMQNRFRRYD